jgi:hypothetical protein
MSRLGVESALTLVEVEEAAAAAAAAGSHHWLVVLEGVTVAHVTAAFNAVGTPARVTVQVDVDLPVQRTGDGWLVDLGMWADYRCAGCGLPGEGNPWCAVLGEGRDPAKFHGPGCLAPWAEQQRGQVPT